MSPREPSLASPWIRRYAPAPGAPVRLVCLPHAGGSATFYSGLARTLAPDVDVLAVQYPGRLDRRAEALMTDLAALADVLATELVPWTGGAFALFGHSLGAMVAFETARRLEAAGRPPVALFVSGRNAPSLHRGEFGRRLDDAALLQQMRGLGGTDPRVFADEDLMRLALPVLRADYRMVEDYRYVPGPPLGCPVTALNGRTDPKVSSPGVDAWREHTAASFESLTFPGGHFYLVDRHEEVTTALTGRLSRLTGRPGP
ncbi:thioesterase II family protein [Streptomyces sp. NPDC003401]